MAVGEFTTPAISAVERVPNGLYHAHKAGYGTQGIMP
jgi:hypothetical protein